MDLMTRLCSISACLSPTSGYSTKCDRHRRALRRHGHAEQQGVSVHDLQPFRKAVAARRMKNPTNPAWGLLQARWEALTSQAVAVLDAFALGAPTITYERMAAELLIVLRDAVPAEVVVDTALAMVAMENQLPGRFRSDRAFLFEMARRVRGLANVNAGSRWSPVEARMKRTYTEVPPRVLERLGASLQLAFGVAGMRLAELDKRDAQGKQAERVELHDALKDMS